MSVSSSARVCLTGLGLELKKGRFESRQSSSGSVSMGCSSSSTQELAEENRPRVKAEDASREYFHTHKACSGDIIKSVHELLTVPNKK